MGRVHTGPANCTNFVALAKAGAKITKVSCARDLFWRSIPHLIEKALGLLQSQHGFGRWLGYLSIAILLCCLRASGPFVRSARGPDGGRAARVLLVFGRHLVSPA